jgi:hypothetical protein
LILEVVALALTIILAVQAFMWPRPWNNDKPSVYFGHKIRVGMVQDFSPWNTQFIPGDSTSPQAVGFENELAEFIADHYGVPWEPIRINSDERAKKLADGDLDIVISGFTITQSRAETNDPKEHPVDFAGPYFIDTTGVWENLSKEVSTRQACVVGGTTGNSSLDEFRQSEEGADVDVVVASNSGICMQRFQNPKDPVAYFATDWSNMKAGLGVKPKVRIGDANRTHPNIDAKTGEILGDDPGMAPWKSSDRPQYYGVAIRDKNPISCRDLTSVINDFLTQTNNREKGFSKAYITNLLPVLGPLRPNWHEPESTSAPWFGSAWVCK